MVENFDDILPPQRHMRRNAAPAPQDEQGESVSIRSLGIESDTRMQRRARRAERRPFIPEGSTSTRSGNPLLRWAIGIVALALLLVIGGLLFFVNTTVAVTPYTESIVLSNNGTFSAYAQPEGGELGFTTYNTSGEKRTALTATDTKYVERYASGVITVYNNYDSSSQRLIKNTRFENTNGKIYRVRNSIVIPGKTANGPGSIDVTVYADVAGEASNMQSGSFTIPGLQGDPRFDAFSAKVKTPIAGGFVGNEPTVDEAELERTRATLRTELQQELLAQATAAQGTDAVVFSSLARIVFTSDQTAGANGTLEVTERATLDMPVFNAHSIARAFLDTAVASTREGTVAIDSYDTLTVAPIESASPFTETGVVQFTASGEAQVTWSVDTTALARDLAGKHQSILSSTAAGYPGIQKAAATIRPFWKTSFPNNVEDIEVTITQP